MLDVMNQGTYLDLSSQLSWIDLLGPMEGLLSSELDPDRWRVTGAASLFNPVPEPSTLTLLSVGIGLTGIAMTRRRVPKGSILCFRLCTATLRNARTGPEPKVRKGS